MTLYDLDTLKIGMTISTTGVEGATGIGIYDLTELTYQFIQSVTAQYFVEPQDEMRMDNISNNIYGSSDYVDILMDINDIDNPLNVMSGDTLIYVDPSVITSMQIASNEAMSKIKQFINLNKTTQVDNSRSQYVNNNYSVQPTVQDSPKSQVKVSGNTITIGDVGP
jgi:hypothetical protein